MKRPKRADRTEHFHFRVSCEERQALEDLAVHEGVNAADVVRRLVAQAHKKLHYSETT